MSNARIGFSRHRGFAPFSWAIMLVERTPFSHAYLKFYSESLDRWLVYEATGKGVFFKALPQFEATAEAIAEYELPVPDDKRTDLLRWAVDQSGKPYSRMQCVAIFLRRVGQRLGLKVKLSFKNEDSRYICDELVFVALRQLNYATPEDLDVAGLQELKDTVGGLNLVQVV